MSLDDRIGYLLLGLLIGFVLGYIVRGLRSIKEEVKDVHEILEHDRKGDEYGFITNSFATNVGLFLVVLLTIFAAFSSQKASNDIKNNQDTISSFTYCNQQYLSKTIDALNERTEFSRQQASTNVELQKAQGEFLSVVLKKPPNSIEKREEALVEYFDALNKFVMFSAKNEAQVEVNQYPTNTELSDCIGNNKLRK